MNVEQISLMKFPKMHLFEEKSAEVFYDTQLISRVQMQLQEPIPVLSGYVFGNSSKISPSVSNEHWCASLLCEYSFLFPLKIRQLSIDLNTGFNGAKQCYANLLEYLGMNGRGILGPPRGLQRMFCLH
ncbi:hypothetical protein RFI_23919 [Reticulomyxa filosa]|uniref:Uncharacterized protein n=1 Tax=Reticulomyxa filosa TaxID=46433 RepID=X6MJ55_RETFI|nr:hypothetical protein RFI_23919 [Reticulomyxa filosa]|eukprot:ETO13457.1 hypothetical protein RFI_23919 [Reticulomyxa filosa]